MGSRSGIRVIRKKGQWIRASLGLERKEVLDIDFVEGQV